MLQARCALNTHCHTGDCCTSIVRWTLPPSHLEWFSLEGKFQLSTELPLLQIKCVLATGTSGWQLGNVWVREEEEGRGGQRDVGGEKREERGGRRG